MTTDVTQTFIEDAVNAILAGNRAVAAAWICYNGVTNTIKSSYNVDSITDNSPGDHTINFTNNMANTDYVVVGTVGFDGGTASTGDFIVLEGKTVSGFTVKVTDVNANKSDMEDVNIIIFGDLA